jgi:hypothetical protein
MKRIVSFVTAVFVVALTGCGSGVTWVASDPVQMGAKPDKFDMPVMKTVPSRPHRILGELTVTMPIEPSFREISTYDQALVKLKKEAVKRGADAVVDLKTLDSQKKQSQGRLTLVGTLVIFTAPQPLDTSARTGGSR